MCFFIQQTLTRQDHVQGCKASIYFEEFLLGKMDKKAKEERTDTIQYDTYFGRGQHGVIWVRRQGVPYQDLDVRESEKLSGSSDSWVRPLHLPQDSDTELHGPVQGTASLFFLPYRMLLRHSALPTKFSSSMPPTGRRPTGQWRPLTSDQMSSNICLSSLNWSKVDLEQN